MDLTDEDNKDCLTNDSDISSFSYDQSSDAEISQVSPLPPFLGALISGLKQVTEIVDTHSESIKHSILNNDTSKIAQICNSLKVTFVVNTSVEVAFIHSEIECSPHYKDKTLDRMTDATSQTQLSLDTLTTCENNFNDTPHSFIQHFSNLIRCYSCQFFGHLQIPAKISHVMPNVFDSVVQKIVTDHLVVLTALKHQTNYN